MKPVTTHDEIRDVLGEPMPIVIDKVHDSLHEADREWLAAAPFCMVATAGADGSCDVSPKGDPAGFVLVLDDRTIAIPERPGNRRADSLHNIIDNPHVGLIFVQPGNGTTLRINGRATVVSDADFFDRMIVKGHRPPLALVVAIDEIFFHCSKAFLRSGLWKTPVVPDPAFPLYA